MRMQLRYFFLITTLTITVSLIYLFVRENNNWECRFVIKDTKSMGDFDAYLPVIYVVTPTYTRPTQKADLTRMSYTLMHIPNIHWIVVEDSNKSTKLVDLLLKRSGIRHTLLYNSTPEKYQLSNTDPRWLKPRGVGQRNTAIDWLRTSPELHTLAGVVYFADDDNTYDMELFDEMRYTSTVSVWPVGLVGGLKWESPRIKDGKVIGWITAWKPQRPFPIDMAGFAVNLDLLLKNPHARFHFNASRGYVESSLLQDIITVGKLEPKAENCTKVLVWHTRTEKPKFLPDEILMKAGLHGVVFEDLEV